MYASSDKLVSNKLAEVYSKELEDESSNNMEEVFFDKLEELSKYRDEASTKNKYSSKYGVLTVLKVLE